MAFASAAARQPSRAADAARQTAEPRQSRGLCARRRARNLRRDRHHARRAVRQADPPRRPAPGRPFAKAGIVPDLSADPFYRARDHAAEAAAAFRQPLLRRRCSAIARRDDGFVGPDKELVELVWLPINEAPPPRYAGHHRGRARRTTGPHRARHEPRPSGAALPHAAQEVRAGNSVTYAATARQRLRGDRRADVFGRHRNF